MTSSCIIVLIRWFIIRTLIDINIQLVSILYYTFLLQRNTCLRTRFRFALNSFQWTQMWRTGYSISIRLYFTDAQHAFFQFHLKYSELFSNISNVNRINWTLVWTLCAVVFTADTWWWNLAISKASVNQPFRIHNWIYENIKRFFHIRHFFLHSIHINIMERKRGRCFNEWDKRDEMLHVLLFLLQI